MFFNIRLRKENSVSLSVTFFLIFLVCSCAQTPVTKEVTGKIEEKPAQIESINVIADPSDEGTMIKITSSKIMSYAAFKLVQPLRLVVDFNALPAQGLTDPGVINGRLIKDIHFEKVKDRLLSTRLIATLIQDVECNASEKDRTVTFLLSPKKGTEIVETQLPSLPEKEEEIPAKEPRLFFSPLKTKLNQILGIDFYMLSKGKSRVTVTTTKKAAYDVSRKNSSTLLLEIMDTSIPSELTRYLNSSPFEGTVNRITPIVKAAEKKVDLEIELKEMVPYRVVQTDKEIRLDFSKTSVKPPPKKLTRTRVSKAFVKPTKEIPSEAKTAAAAPLHSPKYKGEKMTLNFSNTDIRNLLKLIATMSNKNIVWGDDVKARVSVSLKNVPWDQALDILLEMNDLDKKEEGNIIWVTTKEKLRDLEKQQEEILKSKLEREKALRVAKMEAKAEVPLVTDYITVNYVEVDAIKALIEENVKGPRGKLSVDKPNKTIIITDIPSNVEKAKKLTERQDRPVKQVMIEARIVEARESFTRDLGVKWDLSYQETASPWGGGGPANITYNFATNYALPFGPAAGIAFANIAETQVLNAQIALAETEGKVKTLSAPKIITRDTVEAIIKQGTTIYIPYTLTGEGEGEEGEIAVNEIEANLELKVTPEITPNDMVIMTIEVSDDYPDWANRSGPYVPINRKSASTKMMVASGDTVVIGGIYKEDKSVTQEGIPWLSKVPILGWLFKTEYGTDTKNELLIFLKPTVVPLGKKGGAM